MSMLETKIVPVILSGGSGARLWPLSRGLYPKQFHDLSGKGKSLFQQTLHRIKDTRFTAPVIVCAQAHNFLILSQIEEAGFEEFDIILEPVARNTAPAITLAAQLASDKYGDCTILVLPSDHLIDNEEAFKNQVFTAHHAVSNGHHHATFGIKPLKAETGYGYIQMGTELAAKGCYHVENFVEKPNLEKAETYLKSGNFLWNSGIFLFHAGTLCQEVKALEPGIYQACADAMTNATQDLGFIRPDTSAFEKSPSISIDYAVMERTDSAIVIPCDYNWSDVGSWSAIWHVSHKDENGNAHQGDVISHDNQNCLLRSEGPLVAAIGLKNLIVVATPDAVLIADQDNDQDVKKVVADLSAASRKEHISHVEIFRPWGSYLRTDSGPGFETRRLIINPRQRISYQAHDLRNEHWVVVSGALELIIEQDIYSLGSGQSAFAEAGAAHALHNAGDTPVHVIEIRTGSHISEEDIQRFTSDS